MEISIKKIESWFFELLKVLLHIKSEIMNVSEIAKRNQDLAWKIIEETNIIGILESIGAKVNLVGSLKSGLLMKNRDIDFHIYTDKLIICDSFAAIGKLAENHNIKDITYKNLIDTEEECIEWHAWYQDQYNEIWQIDIIHIRSGSAYDGVVERMTDSIIEKLTPQTKNIILQIKYDIPDDIKIIGADIYYAVLFYGIKNYKEFSEWMINKPDDNLLDLFM